MQFSETTWRLWKQRRVKAVTVSAECVELFTLCDNNGATRCIQDALPPDAEAVSIAVGYRADVYNFHNAFHILIASSQFAPLDENKVPEHLCPVFQRTAECGEPDHTIAVIQNFLCGVSDLLPAGATGLNDVVVWPLYYKLDDPPDDIKLKIAREQRLVELMNREAGQEGSVHGR